MRSAPCFSTLLLLWMTFEVAPLSCHCACRDTDAPAKIATAAEPAPATDDAPVAGWQASGIKAALADSAPVVRAGAVQIGLGKGWTRFLEPQQLIALLQHPAKAVRLAAIRALGRIGSKDPDAGAASDLLPLLKDAEPEVREAAAAALGPLAAREPSIAREFLPLLTHYDHDTRSSGACAFGHIGATGGAFAAQVATLLEDNDAGVRAAAADALGRMGPEGATFAPSIVPLLRHAEPETTAAITALGQMSRNGAATAARLLPLLEDGDPSTREAAAKALGGMGEEGVGAAAAVAKRLADLAPEVRSAAVEALGMMAQSGAGIDQLAAPFLADANPGARISAAAVFCQLGAQGAAFASQIAELLEDGDADVRAAAARALGSMGRRASAQSLQLTLLLIDSAEDVRFNAANALVLVDAGSPDLPERLRHLLQSTDDAVRKGAVFALGRIDGADAAWAKYILPYLFDFIPSNRFQAAKAIGNLGKDAMTANLPRILPLLVDSDGSVAELAAKMTRKAGMESLRAAIQAGAIRIPDAVVPLVDDFGNQSPREEDRIAFLSAALEELQARPVEQQPSFRAHLRLWCGGDERLQRALDWLGNPIPTPDSSSLTSERLRQLVPIFSRLWATAPAWSREFDELAQRIAMLASAVAASGDSELARAFNPLHEKCQAREDARQAALRLDKPPEADDRSGISDDSLPALQPWQIAGIKAAMADPSDEVRKEALKIFAEDPDIVTMNSPGLLHGDKQWGRRLSLSQTLSLLSSEDPYVSTAAAMALGQMGKRAEPFAALVFHKLGFMADTQLSQMERGGADVGPMAAAFLGNLDPEAKLFALKILTAIGAKAAPFAANTAPLLADANPAIRGAAASALAAMGAEGAAFVPQVATLLDDPEREPRGAAVAALAEMDPAGAVFAARIISRLHEDDFSAEALWQMGRNNPTVAAQVAALLADPVRSTRHFAAQALGGMGKNAVAFASRILPLLKDADEDEDLYLPSLPAEALGKLGQIEPALAARVAPLLKDREPVARRAAVEALGAMENAASPFAHEIAALLKDEDSSVRGRAAEALGRIGEPGAAFAAETAALLQDKWDGTRQRAAEALGRMGSRGAAFASQLVPLLKDNGEGVAESAMRALGDMGAPGAAYAAQIVPFLADNFGEFSLPATEALRKMRQEGVDVAALSAPYLMLPDSRCSEPVMNLLDQIGNQSPNTKARDTLVAYALQGLQRFSAVSAPTYRAHLRLWCGGDERLELALDWLGAPNRATPPKPSELSPAQTGKLLAVFSDLWQAVAAIPEPKVLLDLENPLNSVPALPDAQPLVLDSSLHFSPKENPEPVLAAPFPAIIPFDEPSPRQIALAEIADRVAEVAAVIPSAPDAGLGDTLRKLRAQCRYWEKPGQAIERALERVAAP